MEDVSLKKYQIYWSAFGDNYKSFRQAAAACFESYLIQGPAYYRDTNFAQPIFIIDSKEQEDD